MYDTRQLKVGLMSSLNSIEVINQFTLKPETAIKIKTNLQLANPILDRSNCLLVD